jgi:hypothetical protein
MDKNFEVNAECCELFVDHDQESIKCLRGDVRTETDHSPEALGPYAQYRHNGLHGLDPLSSLLGEFLNELVRKSDVPSHPRNPFRFFAVGPRYAPGSGDAGAHASNDSEALLFEQLGGFSGSKSLLDNLTTALRFVDGMGDGLYHGLGTAKVFLVTVGIWSGFDDSM